MIFASLSKAARYRGKQKMKMCAVEYIMHAYCPAFVLIRIETLNSSFAVDACCLHECHMHTIVIIYSVAFINKI
jgi:hypothetical protein